MSVKIIANYIGGALVAPEEGGYIDNINPSTGEVYGKIPSSQVVDVERAVASAREAFPSWSTTSAAERSRVLVRIADLIGEHRAMMTE